VYKLWHIKFKSINPSNISTTCYFKDISIFNMFILLYKYIVNNIRRKTGKIKMTSKIRKQLLKFANISITDYLCKKCDLGF